MTNRTGLTPLNRITPQTKQAIISVWREGKSDTVDIASQFRIAEASAYSIIGKRDQL